MADQSPDLLTAYEMRLACNARDELVSRGAGMFESMVRSVGAVVVTRPTRELRLAAERALDERRTAKASEN
jgi:hypothetical protein